MFGMEMGYPPLAGNTLSERGRLLAPLHPPSHMLLRGAAFGDPLLGGGGEREAHLEMMVAQERELQSLELQTLLCEKAQRGGRLALHPLPIQEDDEHRRAIALPPSPEADEEEEEDGDSQPEEQEVPPLATIPVPSAAASRQRQSELRPSLLDMNDRDWEIDAEEVTGLCIFCETCDVMAWFQSIPRILVHR
jgi:hypothetical protein